MNNRILVALTLASLSLSVGCHQRKAAPVEDGSSGGTSARMSSDSGITSDEINTLHRNFRRVLFDFDTATLTEEARDALRENAAILIEHPEVSVQIEGHTDHFGSDEYNLALGQRRAQSVSNYLSDMSVAANQLKLISYGREKTLVPPSTVEQEAVNRRAEFVVADGTSAISSSTIDDMKFHVQVK